MTFSCFSYFAGPCHCSSKKNYITFKILSILNIFCWLLSMNGEDVTLISALLSLPFPRVHSCPLFALSFSLYIYLHTRTYMISVSSVQSFSHVRLFATPWTAAHWASLSVTNSWSPPKPMSIEMVMPSNHLILCHPLLLLPSIFPSIRVFSSELTLQIRWPKYWSLSFSISPSSEYSGLISFKTDSLDAVYCTLHHAWTLRTWH